MVGWSDVLVGGPTLKMAAAGCPDAPPDVLAALARDPDPAIRRTVAANASVDARTLVALLQDPVARSNAAVNARVADVPVHTLWTLHTSPGVGIGWSLARNPATPVELLRRMSTDEAYLDALGANPSTPPDALRAMADHHFNDITQSAFTHPSSPPDLLWHLFDRDRETYGEYIARNPSCPPDLLAQAMDQWVGWEHDAETRADAAEFHAVTPNQLARLASDVDAEVRCAAAANPRTPVAALERLAEDPDRDTRRASARNPSTPESTVRRLSQDPDREVRVAVVRRVDCAPDIFEVLKDDADWLVRMHVVTHENASDAVVEWLADDVDALVKDAAVARLATDEMSRGPSWRSYALAVRLFHWPGPYETPLLSEHLDEDLPAADAEAGMALYLDWLQREQELTPSDWGASVGITAVARLRNLPWLTIRRILDGTPDHRGRLLEGLRSVNMLPDDWIDGIVDSAARGDTTVDRLVNRLPLDDNRLQRLAATRLVAPIVLALPHAPEQARLNAVATLLRSEPVQVSRSGDSAGRVTVAPTAPTTARTANASNGHQCPSCGGDVAIGGVSSRTRCDGCGKGLALVSCPSCRRSVLAVQDRASLTCSECGRRDLDVARVERAADAIRAGGTAGMQMGCLLLVVVGFAIPLLVIAVVALGAVFSP